MHMCDKIAVMETDIDDMNPEFMGHVMERLINEGALDVSASPSYMKKSRPGYRLTVLCNTAFRDSLLKILMEETSTLGVRFREEDRMVLARRLEEVDTPYGRVRVKVALNSHGSILKAAPEYEDCKKIALREKVPLMKVYEEALKNTSY